MTLIGLDLNATRTRAVSGRADLVVDPLLLEGDRRDLPTAVHVEGRLPVVGRPALQICRRSPSVVVLDFLAELGLGRSQATGGPRLDADTALSHVLHALQNSFGRCRDVAVALPPYLTDQQAQRFAQLTARAKWRLLATAPTALLAAAAAQAQLPWSGLAFVLDLDGSALTWSAVAVEAEQVRRVDVWASRRLARGAWLQAVLDGAARRCIRISQRDPRVSAAAEQSLYDQVARLLCQGDATDRLEVHIHSGDWSQHLDLRPADLARWCAPLAKQTLILLRDFASRLAPHGPAAAVLATSAAARLPGLVPALQAHLTTANGVMRPGHDSGEWGDGVLSDSAASAKVFVLDVDDVARAAHALGSRVVAGTCAPGHYDALPLSARPAGAAPLASSAAIITPLEAPARLVYDGMDHPLARNRYLLGRDPACDLVFPSNRYPTVSARHCEIIYETVGYMIRDHSRHGTLVNDLRVVQPIPLRSGDCIRLGPEGPIVQFVGQPAEQPALTR